MIRLRLTGSKRGFSICARPLTGADEACRREHLRRGGALAELLLRPRAEGRFDDLGEGLTSALAQLFELTAQLVIEAGIDAGAHVIRTV